MFQHGNSHRARKARRGNFGVRMFSTQTHDRVSLFQWSSKFSSQVVRLVTVVACAMMSLSAAHAADENFASIMSAWQKMDGSSQTTTEQRVSIPSRKPVETEMLTSSFGTRSDPFNGKRRMHQGIDIPGPVGTPIYATADGIVSRAERAGGYGNLIQLNHGNGLETRYGHLSRIYVQANERVRRGQLIGLMGSTGRSTGSHLHYEVRIAGNAVNPTPYLEGTNFELALNERRLQQVAMGGPEAKKPQDNAE